ncbi:condensation domain-containing protein [Sphaerimonospora mesophila]|uniref:condensation domain-containing protein n=1 Tax=Sphaerimonospora mesophila TaxID=37483 RepID=UPI0006E238C3
MLSPKSTGQEAPFLGCLRRPPGEVAAMTRGSFSESATVTFTGARAGEAPLTWGQRLMWRAVHLMGDGQTFLNCPWVLPVYGERDLGAVLDALRRLIERHESLRTTFAATPEGPVQRVKRDGELVVRLVEAGSEPALRVAERLAGELRGRVFTHGEELPLRCAIVFKDGRPRALGLAFTHLAVDFQALNLLAVEWRGLLRGERTPPPEWQPMDQAALESTEPFAARSARSVRYWRSVLEEAPLDVFDHLPREADDPRFIEVGMESVALPVAAERLAERWSVSTTSVLLAACATVLATVSGRRRAVMQLVHSNRREPRTRAMVGTVEQDGLFALDLPGSDFAATCRAAHHGALAAYRGAQYDPFAMQAMREEIGRLRGREPDLDAFFNDRRTIATWPGLPRSVHDEDPARLAERTSTHVTDTWPGVRFKVFFTVGTALHTGQLGLIVDTAYLSQDTARAMLLGVEALLVRGLTEDVPMAAAAQVCGISAYDGTA